jgi:hypothetical protein
VDAVRSLGVYEEDEATTKAADTRLRDRIADFTGQQRAAVRAFLALAHAEPELDAHHDAIKLALSTIWV